MASIWTSSGVSDGQVTFERAYYSAPPGWSAQRLQVCGGLGHFRIFTDDYQLVGDPRPGRSRAAADPSRP